METESADAGVGEFAGDWQKFCHRGHVTVEGGVETGDLRAGGERFCEGFDQGDFAREMAHVQWLGSTKLGDHLGSDELVFEQVKATVDNAMADGGDGAGAELLADVSGDGFGGGLMIIGLDWLAIFSGVPGAFGDELGIGIADAFYLAGDDSFGGIVLREDGEFDAGRAGVDGEDK